MDTSEILKSVESHTSFIKKAVMVFTPIALAAGGYIWYMTNIWKPTVAIVSVDYDQGIATLTVNSKTRVLYAGSTISAGYSWGVRFSGSQTDEYDRIEVVKNDLTYKTISTKTT